MTHFAIVTAPFRAVSRATVGLAAALCATSCGPGSSGSVAEEVPDWPSDVDLRIGAVDDPEYSLTWFRNLEVGRDGTIYTLHPQEQVVRMFDAEGRAVGVIGGRGDGPGELQNAGALGWVADTLWVLDYSGYRFNQYDASGGFLGSFSVPFVMGGDRTGPQPARARGLLSNGTVHGSSPAWSSQIQDGTLTHDGPLLMQRDGSVTDTLPSIAFGRNQWSISDPDAPDRGGMYTQQPFADGPLWSYVPGAPALLVLTREAPASAGEASFRITKLSFAGDTIFTRAHALEARPVPQEEVDSVLDAVAARLGDSGFLGATAAQGRAWAELSLYRPPFRPPVTAMVVARDGGIWLGLGPGDPGLEDWLVLDAEAVPRGRVSIPAGMTPMVIDPPYLWGAWHDDLDVPYILRVRVAMDAPRSASNR